MYYEIVYTVGRKSIEYCSLISRPLLGHLPIQYISTINNALQSDVVTKCRFHSHSTAVPMQELNVISHFLLNSCWEDRLSKRCPEIITTGSFRKCNIF